MRKLIIGIILLLCAGPVIAENSSHVFSFSGSGQKYDTNDQEVLGSVFSTTEDGQLLKIRFLCNSADGSDHTIRIWEKKDNHFFLVSGPYIWNITSGTQGWMEYEFTYPVPVDKDKIYLLSVGKIPETDQEETGHTTGSSVSLRTSNPGISAQNGGATIETSWFISNSSRIAIVSNIKFKAGNIGPSQTICSNTKPDVIIQTKSPSGGTGIFGYQWQSSSDSVNWKDITDAKYAVYSPPSLTRNTFYRCIVSSGAFGNLSTNIILIKVLDPLTAGSIGSSQTICYNAIPSLLSQKTNPSGGSGFYSYQWQQSTDGTSWAEIQGASQATYQPSALSSNTWYRRNVTSENCDVKSSNTVQIKVVPQLYAGTIGTNQTICYNSDPEVLTNITSPTGGTGVYAFQWQRSSDNLSWNNIPGAILTTYSPAALTSNTWYRRNIVSDTCNLQSSNSVLITVRPALTACSIGAAQEICYNSTPAGLTQVTPPSGGTGSYDYQWQSSNDNKTWTNITGATQPAYSPSALTLSLSYRCNATSGTCGSVISNSVQVTVYPVFSPGQIGMSQSICYNETPAPLSQTIPPSGGDGSFSYQWQSSADNSTWNDIPGASSSTFSPQSLTSVNWYRRSVTSSGCGTINSNIVSITVNPVLGAGTIGSDQTICYNTAPAALNQLSAPSGGTGSYTFQWQRSSDNNSWFNISGAVSSSCSPSSLTESIWFRRNTISGDCAAKSSNAIYITVNPTLNSGTIGTSQSICYNTSPSALTQITAPSGGTGTYSYQWQSSTDNSLWNNISGAISQTYAPPALTSTTWYRRNITSGECATVSSPSIKITVFSTLTSGTIGSDQSVCYNNVPATLTEMTAASGGSGTYTYQWQSSPDNSNWTNISGASSAAYSPGALTSSVWYRRNVTSGSCGTANSNSIHITINPVLNGGSIGSDQNICYNTTPDALTQVTAPSGGTGTYTYQWQNSVDNSSWSNISGAANASYSPSALKSDTWFRRATGSGDCSTVNSNTVFINVFDQISLAQLHDSKRILTNTSATINVIVSGGTSPYTIRYTRNGVAQTPVTGYSSGSSISTGTLTTGIYTYSLTSVTDANNCSAQSLGTAITITVISDQTVLSNTALVIVNSSSSYYSDYSTYIKPYLDNFGIPYDVCDVSTASLPSFNDYAVLIFGHRNVYSSGYPISLIEDAVSGGVGLYSFDPHLFDYSSGFNTLITQKSVSSTEIDIPNYTHYITKRHQPDSYNSSNNVVNLLSSWTVTQTSNLAGGTDLATMTSGSQTVALLQAATYGSGKIVRWCGYNWVFESILGPVYGMDDLIWRGIVWAARKPFAMKGLPPMVTMRVDDANGADSGVRVNFEWINICNNYGIIPWVGTFNDEIASSRITLLKNLLDNNLATAAPHAFGSDVFIYFNHMNLSEFDGAANVISAKNFYTSHGLKMSKYLVPHFYELNTPALSEIRNMGVEFIATHMLPDQFFFASPSTPWINCGPYRINRYGNASGERPVYYGGYVNLGGISFFDCLIEISDDGGYEWYPSSDVSTTVARGIRHLRRSFNSMVLASLFTHEYYMTSISVSEWTQIISQITSNITEFNPEYRSTDYAVQYIRANNNITITGVTDNLNNTSITYSGSDDMDTKCYLFNDSGDQVVYQFVTLPKVNGTNQVTVTK
jgi:hypothetical protein